jgi:hypothetical protein
VSLFCSMSVRESRNRGTAVSLGAVTMNGEATSPPLSRSSEGRRHCLEDERIASQTPRAPVELVAETSICVLVTVG